MRGSPTVGGLLLALGLMASTSAAALEADVILNHGEIYTPGGWAQALAIKNGVIVAVGDEAAVAPFKAATTQVLDLRGATVVPGLHDMHVHPMGSGLLHSQCLFPQGSPPQKVLETVKACVAKHAKGEWITGGNGTRPRSENNR